MLVGNLAARAGVITNAPAGEWSSLHRYGDEPLSIRWQLFSPSAARQTQPRPLVIWLHGGAKFTGQPDTINPAVFTAGAAQERFPCFVLVPCAVIGRNWVSDAGRKLKRPEDIPQAPTASMALVAELLDKLVRDRPIDPARVCIGGSSGGGYGTWAFLHAYPDRFASAFPIAGGGDPGRVGRLGGIRIWIFHGAHDSLVPVKHAHAMFQSMLRQQGTAAARGETPAVWQYGTPGGQLRLTIYRAGRHDAAVIEHALGEPDFLEWLFAGNR